MNLFRTILTIFFLCSCKNGFKETKKEKPTNTKTGENNSTINPKTDIDHHETCQTYLKEETKRIETNLSKKLAVKAKVALDKKRTEFEKLISEKREELSLIHI